MPKEKAVGRPHGVKIAVGVRPPGVIGGTEWCPLIACYCLLSLVFEHDKMGGTESENSSIENFPFRDTYFVMRLAKQKTDTKFHLRKWRSHIFVREIFVRFHIYVGRTLSHSGVRSTHKKTAFSLMRLRTCHYIVNR